MPRWTVPIKNFELKREVVHGDGAPEAETGVMLPVGTMFQHTHRQATAAHNAGDGNRAGKVARLPL